MEDCFKLIKTSGQGLPSIDHIIRIWIKIKAAGSVTYRPAAFLV